MDQIKPWQFYLALLGGMLWLAAFPAMDFVNKRHLLIVSQPIAGYVIGVVSGLSGFIFVEILKGNFSKFVAHQPLFKPISLLSLFITFAMGAFAIYSTNYINISGAYNTAVLIGSIVSGWGIVPILKLLDSAQ